MKKRTPFKHLTSSDRDRLHALYMHGHTQNDMADILGVHKSTITRELARYGRTTWRYNATRAQKDAEEKRTHSKRPGMKIAEDARLRRYLIRQLKKLRSPDEIAGRMKKEGLHPRVGTNAIYKWLYSDDGKPYCRYLCSQRTRKKRQSRLGKKTLIPDRIPLSERPNEPYLVHAERDLFVSPTKLKSKSAGLLIVVPESKLLTGSILPDRTSKMVGAETKAHFAHLHVDTCLADNGSENVTHGATGIPTYFCDPGSPWQKPHVENSIGLIRRWFLPKGTDLSSVPDSVFQSQLHLLNGKYRRSLGYASSYEVSIERGILKRIPRKSLAQAVAFR